MEKISCSEFIYSLKGINETEAKCLLNICANLISENTATIKIEDIIKWPKQINRRIEILKTLNQKLVTTTTAVKTKTGYVQFILFQAFIIDMEKATLYVEANPEFAYLAGEMFFKMSAFDLANITSLESRYAKILYEIVRRHRDEGRCFFKVDEFRELMECPKSYKNATFTSDVINPAVKRVQEFYPLLRCDAEYMAKRGRPIAGFWLTFNDRPDLMTLDEGMRAMEMHEEGKISMAEEKQKKIDRLYKIMEQLTDEEDRATLRWCIFHIEAEDEYLAKVINNHR